MFFMYSSTPFLRTFSSIDYFLWIVKNYSLQHSHKYRTRAFLNPEVCINNLLEAADFVFGNRMYESTLKILQVRHRYRKNYWTTLLLNIIPRIFPFLLENFEFF